MKDPLTVAVMYDNPQIKMETHFVTSYTEALLNIQEHGLTSISELGKG